MGSIFSGGENWKIKFHKIKDYQVVDKIWRNGNRNRDRKITMMLYKSKFLTTAQISKSIMFNAVNSKTAKNRLNYLVRGGYLLKHLLLIPNRNPISVYSIGPGSKEDLQYNNISNLLGQYTLTDILKILSVNQLFVRLQKIAYVKINYDIIKPYTAEIEFILKKYGNPIENKDKIVKLKLISIRNYINDMEEIHRQIYKIRKRTIIICHNEDTIKKVQSIITKEQEKIFRYTTDERLLKEAIPKIFSKKQAETDKRLYISSFDN